MIWAVSGVLHLHGDHSANLGRDGLNIWIALHDDALSEESEGVGLHSSGQTDVGMHGLSHSKKGRLWQRLGEDRANHVRKGGGINVWHFLISDNASYVVQGAFHFSGVTKLGHPSIFFI